MRVTAIVGDTGGCGFYRVLQPYTALAAEDHGHDFEYQVRLTAGAIEMLFTRPGDLVVLQRPWYPKGPKLIDLLHERGIPVVVEIDDLIWGIPRWSPAWADWNKPQSGTIDVIPTVLNGQQRYLPIGRSQPTNYASLCRECIAKADAVTCSTKPLADEVKVLWRKKPVYVLPNCVVTENWWSVDLRKRWADTGSVTIGWGGGSEHEDDIKVVGQVPEQVMRKRPDVSLYVFGYLEAAQIMCPDPEMAHRIRLRGWIEDANINGMMPDLAGGCEVGMAPVVDNRFNACKSYLKCLEFGASGVPVVASDTVTYRDYVTDGYNGFLCRKPRDWLRALEVLTTDHEKRFQMGANNLKRAQQYDVWNHWPKWEAMVVEVVERYRAEHPDVLRLSDKALAAEV